jgi:hypothetical protein
MHWPLSTRSSLVSNVFRVTITIKEWLTTQAQKLYVNIPYRKLPFAVTKAAYIIVNLIHICALFVGESSSLDHLFLVVQLRHQESSQEISFLSFFVKL